jgi:hypothetical protein
MASSWSACARREQLGAIAAVTDLPIVLGGVPAELNDLAYLASVGVRVCLQGHLPFAAGVAAIHATLSALRQGVQPSAIGGVAPAALMKQVTRDAQYAQATPRLPGRRDEAGGETYLGPSRAGRAAPRACQGAPTARRPMPFGYGVPAGNAIASRSSAATSAGLSIGRKCVRSGKCTSRARRNSPTRPGQVGELE